MSEGSRNCSNCGAACARLDARFCEFCGHELPRPAAPPPPPRPEATGPFGDLDSRFAALDAHADLARLMRHQPPVASRLAGSVIVIAFLAVFAFVAFAMFLGAGAAGAPGFMRIVPLVMIALPVVIGITMIGKLTKFASSELERQNAVVSDERTEVSGGENASTSYFVTLEFPGGRREEFPTEGRVVGKVRPGDVGIAYLRGGILLDFKRVSV